MLCDLWNVTNAMLEIRSDRCNITHAMWQMQQMQWCYFDVTNAMWKSNVRNAIYWCNVMNTIWQLHCDKYNIYRQIQSGQDNVTNAIWHKQADKLNHTKKETNGIWQIKSFKAMSQVTCNNYSVTNTVWWI